MENFLASDHEIFQRIKIEEENYFRSLQGLQIRALRLHSANNHQVAFMSGLLRSLRERRITEQMLEREAVRLAALELRSKEVGVDECNYLRVKLEQSGDVMVLFTGQTLSTPFGRGTLLRIDSAAQKVTIDLGFGTMYAVFGRVACWCGGVDLHSDSALCRYYESVVRDSLLVPLSISEGRQSGSSAVDAENGDLTDEDRASASSEEEDEDSEDENGDLSSLSNADLMAESLAVLSGVTAARNCISEPTADSSVFPLVTTISAENSRNALRISLSMDIQDQDRLSSGQLCDSLPITVTRPSKFPPFLQFCAPCDCVLRLLVSVGFFSSKPERRRI